MKSTKSAIINTFENKNNNYEQNAVILNELQGFRYAILKPNNR
jgi:hypothetical protein